MEQTIKRLTRSNRDRVFGGVCGGLANYLGVDVVYVRIAYVVLTLFSKGMGVLLYLAAWLIIPLEKWDGAAIANSPPVEPVRVYPKSSGKFRAIIGAFLIIVGILALVSAFMPWFWSISCFQWGGPLLLIVLGLLFLFFRTSRRPAQMHPNDESNFQKAQGAPAAAPPRRLMRRHHGRKIAGICAGIGEYFNMDPTLVRVLWLVSLFVYGTGILLYLVLWLVMPLQENPDTK